MNVQPEILDFSTYSILFKKILHHYKVIYIYIYLLIIFIYIYISVKVFYRNYEKDPQNTPFWKGKEIKKFLSHRSLRLWTKYVYWKYLAYLATAAERIDLFYIVWQNIVYQKFNDLSFILNDLQAEVGWFTMRIGSTHRAGARGRRGVPWSTDIVSLRASALVTWQATVGEM